MKSIRRIALAAGRTTIPCAEGNVIQVLAVTVDVAAAEGDVLRLQFEKSGERLFLSASNALTTGTTEVSAAVGQTPSTSRLDVLDTVTGKATYDQQGNTAQMGLPAIDWVEAVDVAASMAVGSVVSGTLIYETKTA